MMTEALQGEFAAFLQIVLADIVLAGDNAVVVGMAAAGVPPERRRQVILLGIGLAVVLRIIFAVLTTQLLAIVGLTLAGGILLLWVCWKMWRELSEGGAEDEAEGAALTEEAVMGEAALDSAETLAVAGAATAAALAPKSFAAALWQITLADVSMSLDNVLAVAGIARDNMTALVFGLLLSVALMGVAATWIAKLINRHRWIAWAGLIIILFVAVRMIYDGGLEVMAHAGQAS